MSDLLYIECGYIDPYYIDGDEVCDVRGGGGSGSGYIRSSVANAVLARAWMPKKEPENPYVARLTGMAEAAGVEMPLADIKFLAEYMASFPEDQALYIATTAIQSEVSRQQEAQRLRDIEIAEREQERLLGYSPKKLQSAWAELTKTTLQ